jgi:hypothetical protein
LVEDGDCGCFLVGLHFSENEIGPTGDG